MRSHFYPGLPWNEKPKPGLLRTYSLCRERLVIKHLPEDETAWLLLAEVGTVRSSCSNRSPGPSCSPRPSVWPAGEEAISAKTSRSLRITWDQQQRKWLMRPQGNGQHQEDCGAKSCKGICREFGPEKVGRALAAPSLKLCPSSWLRLPRKGPLIGLDRC